MAKFETTSKSPIRSTFLTLELAFRISDLFRFSLLLIRTLNRAVGVIPYGRLSSQTLTLILWLPCLSAQAHIGSPNVFFEGNAGPYPVHVVIQPAEVIPGLAQISVRVESGVVERVTALPIKWNAGRKGAPPPDVAKLVAGETNLYNAQLWFMEGGAQSVEIQITGPGGTGRATIPVDAVARRVMGMQKGLGAGLAFLGLALVAIVVSIIGAAVRESVLEPGAQASRARLWWARGAMAATAVFLGFCLWRGKAWWDSEAADYRNNRLYQPLSAKATVTTEADKRRLALSLDVPRPDRATPLMPDHGKLMHLFLIREPGLDVFAHLHPLKTGRYQFETQLPKIPEGTYRLYADVTFETGSADTSTTVLQIPAPRANTDESVSSGNTAAGAAVVDPDDSWRVLSADESNQPGRCRISDQYEMAWLSPGRLEVNQQVKLRFNIRDRNGQAPELQPYLGMRGHLVLRSEDGSVFIHVHPGGTASMAAMQLSVLRTEGKLPLKAAFGADDPICVLPPPGQAEQSWLGGFGPESDLSFPYAFPRPGRYRLWVQVKIQGKVLTGVFDAQVLQASEKTAS